MKKFEIENFKSFKNKTEIEFSKITLNVGMNSVGKSTVTQSILLLRQLYESYIEGGKNKGIIRLNGYCDMELGQYQDIVSNLDRGIIYTIDGVSVTLKQKSEFLLFVEECRNFDIFFSGEFYYINAERIGPRNYHGLSDDANVMCGIHGEYTYELIEKNSYFQVPEAKLCPGSDRSVRTLLVQIEAWMSYIAPGVRFSVSRSNENRIASMRMRQTVMDMDLSSPFNFGFGISYLLSVVATCLLAGSGATIVIENPEAHLHPAAQSYIGRFLAQMMQAGLNILVETHSEHVINGIRIYALKHHISSSEICINYFELLPEGTRVQRIGIDNNMNIISWPDGFFDQEEKDMLEIRRIRKSNENGSSLG